MKHPALRRLRNFVLILLLAFVCIGGSLLAAASYADPALFHSVVDPVGAAVRDASLRFADWMENLAAAPVVIAAGEVPLSDAEAALSAEDQTASAPAKRSDFVFADPAITALAEADGVEYLLGGNVLLPYFNQGDEAWAAKPFGVDPIGGYGCGPTALAMAVSGLTGAYIDPAEMAAWAASKGQASVHHGSYLSIVDVTAEAWGLDCVSLANTDAEGLTRTLASGGVVVALMGPGHFTSGGHFILLHGVTLTGEILVADPNSRDNSLTTWDPELLLSELSMSRSAGAPLWLLTVKSSGPAV